MRALYVEDNQQDADFVRRALLRATPAIDVDIATSVADAIQRLTDQPAAYQWVLLDLHLPDGDGLQILRYVREQMLPIAVVAITGTGDERQVMQALKLGVDDYLTKLSNELEQLPTLLHQIYQRLRVHGLPLRQHQQQLQKLTQHVPGVITITRYPAGKWRGTTPFVSESLWAIFELTDDEVRNNSARFAERIHVDDCERVNNTLHDIITRMVPTNCEYRLVLPGAGERWVESQVTPERHADGTVDLYSYTFDISDRKAAEQRLIRSESDLRKLTEQVSGLISVARHNVEGPATILYASAALHDVFELEFEEIRHNTKQLTQLVHPDDRIRVRDFYRQMFHDMKRRTVEYRVILPSKGLRWLEWQATPERQADGSVLLYTYTFDITERKAYAEAVYAAQASERANRAKTEFLSAMSHELRTPLNAVIGFSQLLQMHQPQPLNEEQRSQVSMIEQAGLLLLGIINDVLDLSRIEAGNVPLSAEAINVNAACRDAIGLVAESARKMEVDLDFVDVPGDIHVLADPLRLKQVLVNLLSNAIKYNHAGGRVKVRINGDDLDAGDVAVTVSDTGKGIDAQQLVHLFEPFNRLGAERTAVEGTGIGLVIVKKLTALMHGKLDVTSLPGKGSCFTVRLPVATTPAIANTLQDSTRDDAPIRNGGFSVLYAEDNEVNILVVRKILATLEDCDLRIARSGAEAIAMANDNPPDILLLDMHLGDMNAIDVATALNASDKLEAIPRIVLSADALPEKGRLAHEYGFSAYLTKPVQVKELLACIAQHLPVSQQHSA